MSGYYYYTPEENTPVAGPVMSNPSTPTTPTNPSGPKDPDGSSDHSDHNDSDKPNQPEMHAHNCDECGEDGSNPPTGSDPGNGGSLPDLGGLIPGLPGGGELLDPVTDIVDGLCNGNLQTLDPGIGIGIGELGCTVGECLDHVTGPVGNLGGSVVDSGSTVIGTVGDAVGLPNTAQGLACILDSLGIGNIGSHTGGGVVAGIVNLPHDILTGENIVESVGDIVNDLAMTVGDELSGLPIVLLEDLGSPLLNGSIFGDGDSSGSNVVNAAVGPEQDNGILLDILTQNGSGTGNTANANILDGQQLINADLLNGNDSINLPLLGGVGLDSLNGLLGGSLAPDIGGSGANSGAIASLDVVDDVMAVLDVDGLLDIGSIQTSSNQNTSLLNGLV